MRQGNHSFPDALVRQSSQPRRSRLQTHAEPSPASTVQGRFWLAVGRLSLSSMTPRTIERTLVIVEESCKEPVGWPSEDIRRHVLEQRTHCSAIALSLAPGVLQADRVVPSRFQSARIAGSQPWIPAGPASSNDPCNALLEPGECVPRTCCGRDSTAAGMPR